MFQDCAGAIRQHVSSDRNLRNWFRDVEDQVCAGENISDETMRLILQRALEWSGGNKLWSHLRDRVRETFPELVLLPALVDVFDNYDSLAKTLDALAKIRKIEHKAEIEAEQAKISNSRQQLHEEVEKIREKIRSRTKRIIEDLKKNNPDVHSRLAQEAESEKLQGFQSLFNAINEVEGDLTQVLIAPIRDALKENQGTYELKEKLSEVITPALADDVARAYDLASRQLNGFTHASGYLEKRVREDDKKGVRELENAERAVRLLYHTMRGALSNRAEFTLQARAQKLEDALQSLVEQEENELCAVCLQELPLLKLDEAIISDFKKNVSQNLITLPDKVFEIPTAIAQRHVAQEEVVGKKKETEHYTTGSCFKSEHSREVILDVKGIVEYRELSLPDADMMARQWGEGVAKGKQGLWDVLCKWITDRLDWASKVFDQSVDNLSDLADRALQEQLSVVEQNFATEMQRWSEIEAQKASATRVHQKLEESCKSHIFER